MINLTIRDSERVEIKEEKKKIRWDLIIIAGSMYMLTKVVIVHEAELIKLRKVIEEMKSKGE